MLMNRLKLMSWHLQLPAAILDVIHVYFYKYYHRRAHCSIWCNLLILIWVFCLKPNICITGKSNNFGRMSVIIIHKFKLPGEDITVSIGSYVFKVSSLFWWVLFTPPSIWHPFWMIGLSQINKCKVLWQYKEVKCVDISTVSIVE